MRERIYGIYGTDENYIRRLMNAMNSRKELAVKVQMFTQEEALYRYLQSRKMDMLLVEGIDKMQQDKLQKATEVVYLTEEKEGNEGRKEIYKYQSAEEIIKAVFSMERRTPEGKEKQIDIHCVYSPVSGCGKTLFSLALARWFGNQGRTLYINFEGFSGLMRVLPQSRGNLSDAAYYYRNSPRLLAQKLGEVIVNGPFFDYVPTVECAEDIGCFSTAQWLEFIDFVGREGNYSTLVIDAGNGLKEPWQLLQMCRRMYVPEKSDNVSEGKIKAFEKYLISMEKEELMKNMVKLHIPWKEAAYDEMLLSDIRQYPVWNEMERAVHG